MTDSKTSKIDRSPNLEKHENGYLKGGNIYYIQDEKDIEEIMPFLRILDKIIYKNKDKSIDFVKLHRIFCKVPEIRYTVHQNGNLGIINGP